MLEKMLKHKPQKTMERNTGHDAAIEQTQATITVGPTSCRKRIVNVEATILQACNIIKIKSLADFF